MIRLLSLVIVAGVLFGNAQQADCGNLRNQLRSNPFRQVKPGRGSIIREERRPDLIDPEEKGRGSIDPEEKRPDRVDPEEKGRGSIDPEEKRPDLIDPEEKGRGSIDPEEKRPDPVLPEKKGWPCDDSPHIQCWTDWFDMDDPCGAGDWETLDNLRKENPGKICSKPLDIEAQTLSGLSVAAAGDVNTQLDPAVGFICKNKDQPDKECNDYRVRFSCHPPFCGAGVCWTKWYDRDDPSATGDWELLSDLKKEKAKICDHPLYIEAVTTETLTPASATGEIFHVYNPTQGFACRQKDQKSGKCRDYKVRYGCPCKH